MKLDFIASTLLEKALDELLVEFESKGSAKIVTKNFKIELVEVYPEDTGERLQLGLAISKNI